MDSIFESIGSFGKFQKINLLVTGLCSSLVAMPLYSTVFTTAAPKIHCTSKENASVVITDSKQVCDMWNDQTQTKYTCDFDKAYYAVNMITEWNLVCDREFLAALTQSILLLGSICTFCAGYFSDRYGRRKCAVISCILQGLFFLLQEVIRLFALSVNTLYVLHTIIQFFLGALNFALYTFLYINLIEYSTKKHYTLLANVKLYFYVFGQLIVLGVAYLTKSNWNILGWTILGFMVAFTLIYVLWTQESPCYLIARHRYEEAYAVVKRIATYNGTLAKLCDEKTFIAQVSSEGVIETAQADDKIFTIEEQTKEEAAPKRKNILIGVLWPLKVLVKTALLSYVFFQQNLVYYGMSLGIIKVTESINPYLMFLFSAIAEFIGYASCHLNDKFGRKLVFMSYLVVTSVLCVAVVLVDQFAADSWGNVLIIILVSLGKAPSSGAFNSFYIYNSLFYPTAVSNTALLFTSSIGKVGAYIAPFVNSLNGSWPPLPYLIYTILSVLGAVFIFLLPNPTTLKF